MNQKPAANHSTMTEDRKLAMLEALLFAAEEPLDEAAIAQAAEEILEGEVPQLVEDLDRKYRQHGHGIVVQRVAGGWRLATAARYAEVVKRHFRGRLRGRLTRASLETVSIVAYRQPISRSEVEALRGVECGPVLRHLLHRGLVRVVGRAQAPGRPLLYGTTDQFLTYFGLDSLKTLPRPEEIFGEEAASSGEDREDQKGPFVVRSQAEASPENPDRDAGGRNP